MTKLIPQEKLSATASASLFKQLHANDVPIEEIIGTLDTLAAELKPEDIINNAVKLEAVYANQLLGLLSATTISIELSNVSIQPDEIDNKAFKITLLSYLGGVEQPKAPLLIARFLKDPDKIVSFEALRALQRLSLDFDVSILLPHVNDMSSQEQGLAMKIITKQADSSLVGHLSDYLVGGTTALNKFYTQILVDHVDTENFEIFLKRLSLEDEVVQKQTIAQVQSVDSKNISNYARMLLSHQHDFVRESVQQLASTTLDSSDIRRLEKFAGNENRQVRLRAIQSLGKSANRTALSTLKDVLKRWPEDADIVLEATRQLGFSKGLEIAIKCLDSTDPEIQRLALETIEAITNEQHSISVRDSIIWKIPALSEAAKDQAKSLIIKLTWDFRLPNVQLDESMIDDLGIVDFPLDYEELDVDGESPGIHSPLDDLKPGDIWMERYHIKKEIGRGAMGRVMLVEDEMVDELMILKFMQPELTSDDDSTERFKREVKYTRRIGHKNVIRVHDLLIQDELCAISMEYFESRGLEAILRETGAFDTRDGLKILYQISSGMIAAHEQKVIHRDLKPSNVLIGDSGLVKIVDFGIAFAGFSTESTLTRTGSVIGSPAYLAPERVRDSLTDERSDIYSLGILAYFVLGGKLPYQGNPQDVLKMHCQGGAPAITNVNRMVAPNVAELVHSMMSVEPDNRPQSMINVRNQIKELLETG